MVISKLFAVNPVDATLVTTGTKQLLGLEFDQVVLEDDFHDLVDKKGRRNQGAMDTDAFEQEVNLLYVALTRARRAVEPNHQLRSVLDAVRGGTLHS